jgi:hypothetical protein
VARFGVTAPSTRRLRSPVADAGRDLSSPKPFKGAILASKTRASGECRLNRFNRNGFHGIEMDLVSAFDGFFAGINPGVCHYG